MQSLLQDRKVGKVGSLEFARTLMDSSYFNLEQSSGDYVFPVNCHSNAAVNSLSLESVDYQFLLSGCADSSIKLWDTKLYDVDDAIAPEANDFDHPRKTFRPIATIPRKSVHDFGVSCIQWWPVDTGIFVSGSFDHTVKVWDTNELVPVHTFKINNRVYSFDINSTLIATASDQPFIRLLDIRSTSDAHTLTGHREKTISVKWHPKDPNILASGGFDGEIKIWDIRRSKSCLCRLDMLRTNISTQDKGNLSRLSVKAHLAPVNGLVWDPLGHTLFSTGNDDKIRVWDMISSSYPPVNKLISFGPLTRNKYLQTIPLTVNYKYESELQYLLFPSDNSDIFVFRTIDGKLVKRLNRRGSKTLGRTCSIAMAAPFLSQMYCGTIDGEILKFSPNLNSTSASQVVDYDHKITVDAALITQAKDLISSGTMLDIDKLND